MQTQWHDGGIQLNVCVFEQALECFPHCCPHHAVDKFCGASISVKFYVPPARRHELDHIVVFLRLEPSDGSIRLRHGDVMRCDAMVDDVRSLHHPTGSWIPSQEYVLEEATGMATCECNQHNRLGWYLAPQVAASTALSLVAYVFYRDFDHDEPVLIVLDDVSSSPFNVGAPHSPPNDENRPPNREKQLAKLALPSTPPPGDFDTSIEFSLGVVAAFLDRMPRARAQLCVLETCARDTMLLPPVVSRAEAYAFKFPPIFATFDAASSSPSSLDPWIALATGVLACLFERPHNQALMTLCANDASSLLEKSRLRHLYTMWQDAMAAHVNGWLERQQHAGLGVRTHVALAQTLASSMNVRVQAENAIQNAFEWFVAQLRECFMAQQNHPLPQRIDRGFHSHVFNGRWRYVPDESSYFRASRLDNFAIEAPLRWITMAYSFHQRWDGHALHIRSELATHSTDWTELILDNETRVCRVFPNGEPTMRDWASMWMLGDYIGSVAATDSAGVATNLEVTFFSWPLPHRPPLAYVLQVRCHAPSSPHTLIQSWTVSTCAVPRQVDVWGLSASERHAIMLADASYTTVAEFDLRYDCQPSL
ncbi:unnamed protein product [Aphanomyces euteiches]